MLDLYCYARRSLRNDSITKSLSASIKKAHGTWSVDDHNGVCGKYTKVEVTTKLSVRLITPQRNVRRPIYISHDVFGSLGQILRHQLPLVSYFMRTLTFVIR